MQFEPTDDRRMLADSLNRYLADKYDGNVRASVAYEPPYHGPTKWAELAELGVLFALAPEAQGGIGGTGFDIIAVFEALGRAICPEPVLPALMSARLLGRAGADLEPLLTGVTRYAVGIGEPAAPYGLDHLETEATRSGSGWTLNGRKSVVYGGQVADRFLVAARSGEALSVFNVAAAQADVRGYGLIDGGGAAELLLDATPATLLLEDGQEALQDALDAGALALSAEAVGTCDVTFATTLEYLNQCVCIKVSGLQWNS